MLLVKLISLLVTIKIFLNIIYSVQGLLNFLMARKLCPGLFQEKPKDLSWTFLRNDSRGDSRLNGYRFKGV